MKISIDTEEKRLVFDLDDEEMESFLKGGMKELFAKDAEQNEPKPANIPSDTLPLYKEEHWDEVRWWDSSPVPGTPFPPEYTIDPRYPGWASPHSSSTTTHLATGLLLDVRERTAQILTFPRIRYGQHVLLRRPPLLPRQHHQVLQ